MAARQPRSKPRSSKPRSPNSARVGTRSTASRSSPRRVFRPRHDKVVRYAVVGLGYFAQQAVLPAFANARRNSRLVALVSDDATKRRSLARKYKVAPALAIDYSGYDDLLASGDIDAVYITLPNDMHCDYAVRAARAGIHVLTEKPMATTVEECEEMVEEAKKANVRLMVAYRLHFEAANLAAVEAIRKGKLGEARFFDSVFSMPVKAGNIRLQAERGGGPLYDIGIYCVNAARYLFQAEPIDVVARTASSQDPRFGEVDETVSAILTFPGNRIATFTASFGGLSIAKYTVVGTKGILTLDHAYKFAAPMTMETQIGERKSTRKFAKRDQVAPELLHFSECVLRGWDPEPSGKEGLIDIEVIHAIQEAANTGRRVLIRAPERQRRPTERMEVHARPHAKQHLVHAEEPRQD